MTKKKDSAEKAIRDIRRLPSLSLCGVSGSRTKQAV